MKVFCSNSSIVAALVMGWGTTQTCLADPLGLFPIQHKAETQWDQAKAQTEIQDDIDRLLTACPTEMDGIRSRFENYANTRDKGIRNPMSQVHEYAGLLNALPNLEQHVQDAMYDAMLEIALLATDTFADEISHVEGVRMRGWPFRIQGSSIPEFESYQAGQVMEAIALTAEQAAKRGDLDMAARLALTVAAALHDGFLTNDLRRTKVRHDKDSAVVYIPEGAPADRLERYRELHPKWECLQQPQALNHGLAAAVAASALLRAFGAIGWLSSIFHGSEPEFILESADGEVLQLKTFIDSLENFVRDSVKVFKMAYKTRRTGKSQLDMYPGEDGTKFWWWKYRQVDRDENEEEVCKLTTANRPEDMVHLQYEIEFVAVVRSLGKDYYGNSSEFGFKRKHARRLLVTILNRIVIDGGSPHPDDRFACDLNAETNPNTKSCSTSRRLPRRVLMASYLLTAANILKDDPKAQCDAMRLVHSVLPIFLEDDSDFYFDNVYDYCSEKKLLLGPILAKYYYYFYETGMEQVCS